MADLTLDELIIQMRADKTELRADINKLTSELGNAGIKSANSFGASFKSALGALGILAILKKTFDFAVLSKNIAASANEIKNRFGVVFGGLKKEGGEAVEQLSKDFDLAASTTQNLLSNTGDLLTGLKFTKKEALELSKTVVALSGDLTSFKDVEGGVERTANAVTKALLGEREMLKDTIKTSVLESEVKQRANQISLKRKELTDQQAKALATLQIITERNTSAIGDYNNTRDSATNSDRRFQEQLKGIQIAIGQGIIPTYKVLLAQISNLITIGTASGDVFGGVSKIMRGFGIVLSGLIGTIAGMSNSLLGLFGIAKNIVTLDFDKIGGDWSKSWDETNKIMDSTLESMDKIYNSGEEIEQAIEQIKKAMEDGNNVNDEYSNGLSGIAKRLSDLNKEREVLINKDGELSNAEKNRLSALNDENDLLEKQIAIRSKLSSEITGTDIPKGKLGISDFENQRTFDSSRGLSEELENLATTTEEKVRLGKEANKQIIDDLISLENGASLLRIRNYAQEAGNITNNVQRITSMLNLGAHTFASQLISGLQTAFSIANSIASILTSIGSIASGGGGILGLFSSTLPSVPALGSPNVSNIGEISTSISRLSTTLQDYELNRNINPQMAVIEVKLGNEVVGRQITELLKQTSEQGYNVG